MADLELVRRLVAADNGLAVVSRRLTPTARCRRRSSTPVCFDVTRYLRGVPVVGVRRPRRTRRRCGWCAGRAGVATVTFRSGWEWAGVEGPATLIGPRARRRRRALIRTGRSQGARKRRVQRRWRQPRRLGRVRQGSWSHGAPRGGRARHTSRGSRRTAEPVGATGHGRSGHRS